MGINVPQPRLHRSRSVTLIVIYLKFVGPAILLISLILFGGWWGTIHASQQGSSESALLADSGSGGITGYVVGSVEVAAYACPDVNTARCPIRLTLRPGTVVLIIDNVIGSSVPGLNDNAWRKIVYQGQTLFVPTHYISINPPSQGTGPDISLVQTSFEDDSTTPPSSPNASKTAPGSGVLALYAKPPLLFCIPNTLHVSTFNGQSKCCPPGLEYNGSVCFAPAQPTWYIATDGRIDGNAGDRIAIYCRKTGRIEVWSINDSQGHFLVEFNHTAVDAAGSLFVPIGSRVVVTIGGDGHGLYWAAIHGGPFNATGMGDFTKIFHCYTTP